jgi:hypothetical protein
MAAISRLRRGMIDDMMVRNLSTSTQQSYIYAVVKFSRHFRSFAGAAEAGGRRLAAAAAFPVDAAVSTSLVSSPPAFSPTGGLGAPPVIEETVGLQFMLERGGRPVFGGL